MAIKLWFSLQITDVVLILSGVFIEPVISSNNPEISKEVYEQDTKNDCTDGSPDADTNFRTRTEIGMGRR